MNKQKNEVDNVGTPADIHSANLSPSMPKEKTKKQLQDELTFLESDVWELSGVPLTQIKRSFVTIDFAGVDQFEIRVATIGSGPTLVLCHDYMLAGCIQWYPYVRALAEHYRLVVPDMGTYGANSRVFNQLIAMKTAEESETLILEWFDLWVAQMGTDLPEKFSIAGFGNGGYQAGLYASKRSEKIEKLLILSPSQFCP